MKLTSLLAISALTCFAVTAVAEEAAQDATQGAAAQSQDAALMTMAESGKKCDHKKKMHGMKPGDRRQMSGPGMGPMGGQGMYPRPMYGQYPGGPGPMMHGRQGPMGDMAGSQDSPYETTMTPHRGMMGYGPHPMMGRGQGDGPMMGRGMGQGMGQGMGPEAMGERLEAMEAHLANIEKLLQKMVDLQRKQ